MWMPPSSASAAPPTDAPPLAVSVIEPQAQDVPLSPTYLGRAEASQTVEIRARVNGFLEQRTFEEGATVQTGQQLFRIDPKPLGLFLEDWMTKYRKHGRFSERLSY